MDLILVDDNKSFLEALSFFIEKKLRYKVIAQFTSPIDFVASKQIRTADCILLDIEMPEMNGIKAAREILKDNKDIKFIAVTNHIEEAYMHDLISAGFKGCVFKNSLFEKLEEAIKVVTSGRYFFPKDIKIIRG